VDRNTGTTAHDHTARIARAAWFCAFVLPLVLAAFLLGVKSAQAAPPGAGSTPSAIEEELLEGESELAEENEAEFAQEECEIAEEEAAEGEITTAEAKAFCEEAKAEVEADGKTAGPSSTTPGKCVLRSAHAHAVEKRGELKVTIGYTTAAPTSAAIEIRSGPKRIAAVHRHLGRSGVLRITKKLGKKRVKRVVVLFQASSCGKFWTKPARVSS
jgi:hypothetical protein